MTQEQQPYARASTSKLCSTCHSHGQSLSHWRSLILDLNIATLVLASLCEYVSLSVSECEWEWVQISSWNQTASRKRDTHSINQSLTLYSFDPVGTWSTNQSSPLRDTYTNRMLLEATHDPWFNSLTLHLHHQQLSFTLSMMMMILLFCSSTIIIVTCDRQWLLDGPPRERERAWEIETAGALKTKQRSQALKLHSQILWNSHRRATDNQYLNGSLSLSWMSDEHSNDINLNHHLTRPIFETASVVPVSSSSAVIPAPLLPPLTCRQDHRIIA